MSKLKLGLIGIVRPAKEPDPWAACERIAQLGYRGLEGIDSFVRSADDPKAALERLHGLGLKCLTTTAKTEDLIERLPTVIEQAKAVQTDRVSVWWDAFESRDSVLQLAEQFNAAGKQLAAEGLKLCYHHHDHEFRKVFDGVMGFDLFAANTDPEAVYFVIDIAWAEFGGVSAPDLIRRVGKRASSLHIKDLASKTEKGQFTTVGTGLVDTVGSLEAAIEVGLEWGVVEQDTVRNLDPWETITASALNLREMGLIE